MKQMIGDISCSWFMAQSIQGGWLFKNGVVLDDIISKIICDSKIDTNDDERVNEVNIIHSLKV
jgi:hypothetical protein